MHRDIKPGNLLLDDRDRLAIADFGIARLALEDQLTATGQVLGTASYISPEQAVGEPATAASDRYALAVVAFELLTGSRPFQAEHFAAQARAHVEDEPPLATERDPSLPARRRRGARPRAGQGPRGPLAERRRDGRGARPRDGRLAARRPSRRAPIAPVPPAAAQRAGGGAWPWVLAGLAALVVLAVAGAVLLSGGDDGDRRRARSRRDRDGDRGAHARAARPSRPPEPTAEPTPEPRRSRRPRRPSSPPAGPTSTARPTSSSRATTPAMAGDYEQALALSTQALEACGDTKQLAPVRLRALRGRRRAQRARPAGRGDPVPRSSGWTSTGPTRTSRRSSRPRRRRADESEAVSAS